MPIHLVNHQRRDFLKAVGAGIVLSAATSFAESPTAMEEDLIFILNDTHIGEKHPADSQRPRNLRQVVTELVQRKRQPGCVLINGDLASTDGQPGDYRHFAKLIQPLRETGIETHLTLGNHDHRETFFTVLKEDLSAGGLVESKHVSVVQTPMANFFLLDSLSETMVTPGTLGATQLAWLAEALDRHAQKPAIIVAHHNPRLGGDPTHFPGGLTDSESLWNLLAERRQVKAYLHGHIHDRSFAEHRGIHIINTPATSYVANPQASTTGWTTAKLSASGALITTHTIDSNHPWNGETKMLEWRR